MDFIKKILFAFITLIACVSCNQKLELADTGAQVPEEPYQGKPLSKSNLYTYAVMTKRPPVDNINGGTLAIFDQIGTNDADAYSTTNGVYRVKRQGFYQVNAVFNFPPYSAANIPLHSVCKVYVYVADIDSIPVYVASGTWIRENMCTVSVNSVFRLNVGQEFYFKTGSSAANIPAANGDFFYGTLAITEMTLRQ